MNRIPQHTLDFIDSWLDLTTKWEETTGLAVAIMHRGKIIFDRTYGSQRLTKDNVYRVASQSKAFTSVAVMQLQEIGKLRIDDEVVRHLAWLKDHKDRRWQSVTIRQLMNHSAGVMRDSESLGFWSLQANFPSEEEVKKEVMEHDLVLDPNTQLKYSNFGYGLLGMIIERASGQTYDEYVKKNIISELGLEHTFLDVNDKIRIATGYSRKNLKRKRFAFPQISANALRSATGICSKPSDMCIFFDALKPGSGKLLSDVSKREMLHKQWEVKKEDDSYGLGLDLAEREGFQVFGHSGGFPGFSSRTWTNAENDIVISIVVTEYGTWTGPIASSILAIFSEFGDKAPSKELMKYEGRFVGLQEPIEIIAHTGGLRRIYPMGWWPMSDVAKLRVLDELTLQIYDTSGFDDEGEKVYYNFDDEDVATSIKITGVMYSSSQEADLLPWW